VRKSFSVAFLETTRRIAVIPLVALAMWQPQKALGSVGGALQVPCGAFGTLYNNLTGLPLKFELAAYSLAIYSGPCGVSLSWTDADGNAQSVTLHEASSASLSSSLSGFQAISWTSSGSRDAKIDVGWQLERAPAQSVQAVASPTCGSSGPLYTDLRARKVALDFSVTVNSGSCGLTLSWTDNSGSAQTLSVGVGRSQGITTSLRPGGIITWTTTGSSGSNSVVSQIERVSETQV